jgi:hypothetical protein
MSKYDPLKSFLAARGGEELSISFDELEREAGIALPHAARYHRQWWSNSTNAHTQSWAWLGAGFKVTDLDLAAGTIRFVPEPRGPNAVDTERIARRARYQRLKSSSKAS